jgi:PTH1 family peptidyl-tRNA hydrolase
LKLVVGLGNPGPEYAATRHNAGFWFVDAVADRLRVSLVHDRSVHGLVARTTHRGEPLWLLEPMTFMNVSGKSVGALARFFKIAPAEILVVHDELDLLPGQARLKIGGSAAGHNGLKDIQAHLGTQDFWRLRLGIGHPGDRNAVADYVLRKPPASERELIEKSVEQSLGALDLVLDGQLERATMAINARPPRPKPEKPPAPDPPGKAAGAPEAEP